jgi:GntR family transcriptional repressor for pyruvate dehydrogenase complex
MTPTLPNQNNRAHGVATGASAADRRTEAFSPIEVRKASDAALMAIVDAMRYGRYEPGEVLPSERELAQSLHVSRKIVREALDTLRREGIVRVRRGSGGGTVVASLGGIPRVLAGIWDEDPALLRSLLEVRRALETTAATGAARLATAADLEALRQLTGGMEELVDRPQDFSELHLRFHLAVAEIAGNQVCLDLLRQTLDRISVIRELTSYAYVPRLGAMRNMQAIIAALASGEVRRALQALDDDLGTVELVLIGERLPGLKV